MRKQLFYISVILLLSMSCYRGGSSDASLIRRDKQDSERAAAPLKQADDAVLVDNTDLTKEETLEKMLCVIREKTGVSV